MTAHFQSVDQARRSAAAVKNNAAPGEAEAAKPAAPTLTQQQANDVFALYRDGRYEDALTKTGALIALHPNLPLLHNLAGAIHSALGQNHQAIGSYRRAIVLKPERAEAHNNLGDALNRIGRHSEAIGSLARAVALKPDFAEAHNNLGVALAASGRDREAASSFLHAVELRPGFATAHCHLGYALSRCGEDEDAAECFRAAIEAKPDYAEAHAGLGRVLTRLGRAKEGAEACHRALAFDSNLMAGFLNLAAALDRLNEPHAAIACLDHVVKREASNVEVHESLCELLEERNRDDELREAVARARRICGETDPRILRRIALLALRDGDNATAQRYLEKLPEADVAAVRAKIRRGLLETILARSVPEGRMA